MREGRTASEARRTGVERPGRIRTYEDLDAWKLAMDLTEAVYRETEAFPSDETFGLRSQMRRAAVSVPSNITEGWGRNSGKDHARFLRTARGSLYELRTQLEIARRVGLLDAATSKSLRTEADRIGQVSYGLMSSLPS